MDEAKAALTQPPPRQQQQLRLRIPTALAWWRAMTGR
jgi:hypothetical protein